MMRQLPKPTQGQTWVQALEDSHAFWVLPRLDRRRWRKQALLADQRGDTGEAIIPPETAFYVPDGMTPEEATRLKIAADAARWPIERVVYSIRRRVEPVRDIKIKRDSVYTGPRGGRYRINRNGRKSYDVP